MFKNILIPIDLEHREAEAKAIGFAVDLARRYGSQLHVLTVVPDFGMSIVGGYFPKDFEKKALAAAQKELRAFADKAIGTDLKVKHVVANGTIYREIIRYADEAGCDTIVMASHRPELKDYLLGPNAARVVRHARQSVLVVRE